MNFHHDSTTKTLYAVADQPDIILTGVKNGSAGIWKVWATIEVMRGGHANGCDGSLNQCPTEQYSAHRDCREDAIRFFKRVHYPKHPKISVEEYTKLRSQYCNTSTD
jgi:hypothetical protein